MGRVVCDNTAMQVCITGGTGFVGAHLAHALLHAGHDVTIQGRNAARAAPLVAAGARFVPADIADTTALRRACAGAEVVYHAAALSAAWGAPGAFWHSNVRGTAAVLAACAAAGVRRLVYVSSPGVLFDGRDQYAVTEAAPYAVRHLSPYTASKQQAEQLVRAVDPRRLEWVVVRPKAVFGVGDAALLPTLVAAARRGRLPRVGDGNNRVDLTYAANVVDALLLAAHAPAAVGNIYHITNDEHPRLWDVIGQVLAGLHIAHTPRPLAVSAALLLARAMEAHARRTGGTPLLTRYSVLLLARTQTYDITAARCDLGYVPRVPLHAALEHTMRVLQEDTP